MYQVFGKYHTDTSLSLMADSINGQPIETEQQAREAIQILIDRIKSGQMFNVTDWQIAKKD